MTLLAAAGTSFLNLGGKVGLGEVWMPDRDRKVYAARGEVGIPYLRAYDVFDYIPKAADHLAGSATVSVSELSVSPGAILQTRSGRNLGPAIVADEHLATFAISDDLIRIIIDDPILRHYVVAFLSSRTGQALIRRDKTGSVIDHLSVGQLENVGVPMVEDAIRLPIADHMGKAVALRQEARHVISDAVATLGASLPSPPAVGSTNRTWTMTSKALGTRIDAAFYDPSVNHIRRELLAIGGQPIKDVAAVEKPSGRHKLYYVSAGEGKPLLSGRQLLQHWAVNLKNVTARSLDAESYSVKSQAVAFQADGRSEERLGVPVMIEPARDGWLASGHVGRFIAREGIDPGWLYAACATEQVQVQIKALACGSVVDAVYVEDLENVVLPPPGGVDGAAVSASWAMFSEATKEHALAVDGVESEIARITGV
jgi:hypothetical protein